MFNQGYQQQQRQQQPQPVMYGNNPSSSVGPIVVRKADGSLEVLPYKTTGTTTAGTAQQDRYDPELGAYTVHVSPQPPSQSPGSVGLSGNGRNPAYGNYGGNGGYGAGPGPSGFNPYTATEASGEPLTESLPPEVRIGFIRKVYLILGAQLAVTFGIVACFLFSYMANPVATKAWIIGHFWLVPVAFIITFGILIAFACCPGVAQKYPTNYIVLLIFTVCQGILLGVVVPFYKVEAVGFAVLMTSIVTLGLSAFACQTKYDITGKWGWIVGGLLTLLAFALVLTLFSWWIPSGSLRVLQIVYAGLGCLVFSAFLVYDTQMIVGGKHRRFQFGLDDYVFAALSVYLDVINLFTFILQLFSLCSDD